MARLSELNEGDSKMKRQPKKEHQAIVKKIGSKSEKEPLTQISAYIPTTLHIDVRTKLFRLKKTLSDLITEKLTEWNENTEI
jgi:hypothetical protein